MSDDIRVIDINGRFRQDYLLWCSNHKDIAADEERMDEIFADMYDKWFDMPKKWLGDKTPVEYFEDICDAPMYVTLFIEYQKAEVDIPDPLIKCMTDRADEIYPMLLNIINADHSEDMEKDVLEDVQAKTVALIDEMEKPHPVERYIEIARDRTEESSLLDAIALVMETDPDRSYLEKIRDAYMTASGEGKQVLLEMMSYYEHDEGVFAVLACEFEEDDADVAFLANCFGRLGDERAVPLLEEALKKAEDIDYYTYSALREAIEELGGDEVPEMDFYDDKDCEAVEEAAREIDEAAMTAGEENDDK